MARRGEVTSGTGSRDTSTSPQVAGGRRCGRAARNKELKTRLKADRLSDHRYLANLFRLCLHAS